jgi:hypothetical protein
MKKTVIILIILAFVAAPANAYNPRAGWTPNHSILYSIDRLFEKFELAISPNKVNTHVRFAEERIHEAIEVSKEGDSDEAVKLIAEYQREIDLAKERVSDNKDGDEILHLTSMIELTETKGMAAQSIIGSNLKISQGDTELEAENMGLPGEDQAEKTDEQGENASSAQELSLSDQVVDNKLQKINDWDSSLKQEVLKSILADDLRVMTFYVYEKPYTFRLEENQNLVRCDGCRAHISIEIEDQDVPILLDMIDNLDNLDIFKALGFFAKYKGREVYL